MPVLFKPFNALSAEAVTASMAETVARVNELNPSLDLRRGVLAELLVYIHSVLDVRLRTYVSDLLKSRSLYAVTEDPDLADVDVVDDLLSNFRVSREPGSAARGEVTVVVSRDTTVIVPRGSIWQAKGKTFVTEKVFTAKAEESLVTAATDRVLTPLSDGNWAFTIEVVAETVGEAYSLPRDAAIVPAVIPPGYVRSYATSNFTQGLNSESNEEVLQRLQDGIAAKALSGRGNMAAALRELPEFARVTSMSIIGHGDAELVRANRSIFPIPVSGRCDWYIRTSEPAIEQELVVNAVLTNKEVDGTGTWQFSVSKDDVPGVYEFRSIRPNDSSVTVGGYAVVSDVRGIDIAGEGWRPDIISATEAAYSAYSTAVVRFIDPRDHGDFTVGDRQEYKVTAVYLPLIAEAQTWASSREVRPFGSDVLVKAPVPAFTAIGFKLYKRAGQLDPDLDAIKDAVAKVVNTTGFTGKLYASLIQKVAQDNLDAGISVGAINMLARIRYPNGDTGYMTGTDILEVPDDASKMVTPKTVQFFASPNTVQIEVVTTTSVSL